MGIKRRSRGFLIYITEVEHSWLKFKSRETGKSMSAIIVECIKKRMKKDKKILGDARKRGRKAKRVSDVAK